MKNSWSWSDIIAGLSLAGLLLPEAVAYSSIANLPPQAGIVALFAGLVCYGLIGSSRFAIVAATSSSAAVLASATAAMSNGDTGLRLLVATGMVLLTGVFFIFAGMARLGGISDFIAKPVLRGFAFGLAIVIIFKQFAHVVGVHTHYTDMIRFSYELLSQIHIWNWASIAVGLVALLLLFGLARISQISHMPYMSHMPGGLVVILLGILAGKYLHLEQYGVSFVGQIDLDLQVPSLPTMTYVQWLRIGELSVAMLLILYAESYSSVRNFAMKHGDLTSPNRDLFAFGAANLLSGIFQGMPVGAGFSATAANEANGAQSKWAGWAAAAGLLLVILTMLPTIALTPSPILAAIVIHAVSHSLRLSVFTPYFTMHRDRFVATGAVVAVLLLGVLDGLLVAIGVSLLMLLRKLAESNISILGRLRGGHDFVNKTDYPDALSIPGILIIRPETGLFFANAERTMAQAKKYLAAADNIQVVILSLEESPDLDSSSVEAIADFSAALQSQKKHLMFARLKNASRQVLQRALIEHLNIGPSSELSVDDVVTAAQEKYLNKTDAPHAPEQDTAGNGQTVPIL
ncbi:SulP family inorganic anion transporter [Undibacterium sp. CY18W]|uniref:SulP family inorganic anion transporter n=1 Tax=Undibacterium hunanense TaxID=2762292 RepID=A0ABR6ZP93_9BURK|nr:SulP family inorganic anion transporter [Undibacterium hunanense]MBC3917674.1 SulP family inorganic anion transporter [Undibacterium hunanense]